MRSLIPGRAMGLFACCPIDGLFKLDNTNRVVDPPSHQSVQLAHLCTVPRSAMLRPKGLYAGDRSALLRSRWLSVAPSRMEESLKIAFISRIAKYAGMALMFVVTDNEMKVC